MDGSGKGSAAAAADKPDVDADRNPGPDPLPAPAPAEGRRPFTSLTQEEADLALARVLQEQERAYVMLTGHGGGEYYDMLDGDDGYDSYDDDEEEEEEEEVDLDLDLDPARYDDDEAYARALQDAEERQVAGRLTALAGIGPTTTTTEQDDGEDSDEGDGDAQDAWEDVDPDEYSYEELVALGEAVGTESKGLSADTIASLPSVTYQAPPQDDGNMEQCVICRVELEEGESLVALPSCKHAYHSECINHWLQLNKVCPVCGAEVSSSTTTSADKQA